MIGGFTVRPERGSVIDSGKWYDYAGQSIHGDYTVALDQSNAAVVTEKVAREPGAIDYDYSAASGSRQTYLHGNLIGTTEATSGSSSGSPPSAGRAVYTAFGERVYANGVGGGRYGYAGAWGYQAAGGEQCGPVGETYSCDPLAELGWLHVGERYYDSACGRFVQRDPIGIRGGPNVYVYIANLPTNSVDPVGLDRWVVDEGPHQALIYDYQGRYYRVEMGLWTEFGDSPLLWPEQAIAGICNLIAGGTVGGVGRVTKTTTDKPNRPPDIVSDDTEDKILHEKYMDGDLIYYNLYFRSCRNFVREASKVGLKKK